MKTKSNAFICNGDSSHAIGQRQKNDYYATEPKAVEELLKVEKFSNNIIRAVLRRRSHI